MPLLYIVPHKFPSILFPYKPTSFVFFMPRQMPCKRVALAIETKKQVIDFHKQNPNFSHEYISEHFSSLIGQKIGRTTISKILRNQEEILKSETPKKKRKRTSNQPELERLLLEWFGNQGPKIPISDDVLRTKAQEIGSLLEIQNFKFSYGWLNRFKSRHGIKLRRLHGEEKSHDSEGVRQAVQTITEELKDYNLEDIYNIDETALFYKLEPDKTLATKNVKGSKRCKDRITLVLCCNSTGSHKLKPIIIGKSTKPRVFGNFRVDMYCDYFGNANAWMTKDLFAKFLINFDREMIRENRNVALLMDNCSSHKIDLELFRVKIIYFPPNTTSLLQPLDNGIIRNLKLHYKKQLLSGYVRELDNSGTFTRINIKTAIIYVHRAWETIEPKTISNCFAHTNILGGSKGADLRQLYLKFSDTDISLEENQLTELIQRMALTNSLTIQEYVEINGENDALYNKILARKRKLKSCFFKKIYRGNR